MSPSALLALALVSPAAQARVGSPRAPASELSASEVALILLSLMVAAWQFFHGPEVATRVLRGRAGPPPPGEPGPQREPSPTLPPPPPVAAQDALDHWSDDFSEPFFLNMVGRLYGRLLALRAGPDLGPYEALLRPGARETLRTLAGVREVLQVQVGPVRALDASVDEAWSVVEVEAFALVHERWAEGDQAPRDRVRLRRDRFRMQRATGAAVARPEEVATALDQALVEPTSLLLPADLGGWVLAQLQESEVQPVLPGAIEAVDGPWALEEGRPSRVASPELEAQLLALAARSPEQALPFLQERLAELAPQSLAARSAQGSNDTLDAAFKGPARRLHAFWRGLAQALPPQALPPQAVVPPRAFRPARCQLAALRPVQLTLDPWCERFVLGLRLVEAAPEGDPAAAYAHEELWTLVRRHGTDHPWQVFDIAWAPCPVA